MLGAAFGLIPIVLVGWLTIGILGARGRHGLGPELALGFLVGASVHALALLYASLLGYPPSGPVFVIEITVLAFLAGWCSRLRSRERDSPVAQYRRTFATNTANLTIPIALVILMAALTIGVTITSVHEPIVGWDVVSIWTLKAKVVTHEPLRASAYFYDPSLAYSHLDYPLLWPFLIAWTWVAAGHTAFPSPDHLLSPKVLGPALLLAFVVASYAELRTWHPRWRAGLLTFAIAGLPELLHATTQLKADAPLALLFAMAVLLLLAWLRGADDAPLRLAAPLAAGVLFTKNEGLGLWLVVVVALGLMTAMRARRQLSRLVLWSVFIPLVLTAPWFVFRAAIPDLYMQYVAHLNVETLAANRARVGPILSAIAMHVGPWSPWYGLWPAFALALGCRTARGFAAHHVFLIAIVMLGLAMYIGIYIVTPWDPLVQIEFSLSRLVLHLAPIAVLFVGEALGDEDITRPSVA